ncbi:MAG: hypothetical protein JNM90_25285 [Burkholderiales bacterium]|nr:hypothetical protein [Burkholderiales bacterium]
MRAVPDWQQVIDALPQASDHELARLRLAIDEILLDPQRIAEIRARLAVGQTIDYLSERQNRTSHGRIVELMADRVLIQTAERKLRWLHYASIQLDPPVSRRQPETPAPPRFRIGERVSYEDRAMVHRFGTVKRINRISVTVQGDDGAVRIPFTQLRRVVDL